MVPSNGGQDRTHLILPKDERVSRRASVRSPVQLAPHCCSRSISGATSSGAAAQPNRGGASKGQKKIAPFRGARGRASLRRRAYAEASQLCLAEPPQQVVCGP